MVFFLFFESFEKYGLDLMVEFVNRLDWVLDLIVEDEVYVVFV